MLQRANEVGLGALTCSHAGQIATFLSGSEVGAHIVRQCVSGRVHEHNIRVGLGRSEHPVLVAERRTEDQRVAVSSEVEKI